MKDVVVIYPGRFQPFHKSHKETYDNLVKKFGKDSVYIVTSNKVELPDSPFNFEEKKKIMTTMFKDIPADHVIQVKNPYQAVEVLSQYPETTPVIFAVGAKDAERLATRGFFQNYKDGMEMKGNKDKGYIFIAPPNSGMSGTKVREIFNSDDNEAKEKLFIDLYGSMNKPIFNLLTNKIVKESIDLLTEGGAYGHLSHFHDVKTNTFADLKEFIDTILQGKMEYAHIKTDGMNLLFSFIDGQLRGARNSSDLKNFGKDSLTIKTMNDKFKGRGGVQTAYVAAMRDLQHAIGKLPREQSDKIFQNGKNWMSVEVIHPEAQNIVPYGTYELRFHGIKTYDEKGKVIGEDPSAAHKVANMIKEIKQNKQDTYEIKPIEVAVIPPVPDFKAQRAYFLNKANALQKEYKLKDSDTIADAFEAEFTNIIKNHAKHFRYAVPSNVMKGLVERWGLGNKSFKASDISKIDNEKFRDWALEFDKTEADNTAKEVANKFERLTLEVGAVALKNLSTFMVANPKKAVQDIKKGLDDVIRKVQSSNDPKLLDKMKYELERLSSIGGINAIAPEEGITFLFKGQFLKITGAFAPVNQIMNLRHQLAGNSNDV